MLEKYKDTFERLTAIEHEFANGCYIVPHDINKIMLELAGHFTYLNSQKTDLELEKFKKSISIREEIQNNYAMTGSKIAKNQLEQEIDSKMIDLVADIMILEGKLANCDKLISVCQSSLKSIMREGRMPY
jgi:hypothetical protein